jgi:hypothetical protein
VDRGQRRLHCTNSSRRPPSSSLRWIRRTMVSPAISSQIRNGCPGAAESDATSTCGTGAPAATAAACTAASSSIPAWMSSGGAVRRISAAAVRPDRVEGWCGWLRRSAPAGSRCRCPAGRSPRSARRLSPAHVSGPACRT